MDSQSIPAPSPAGARLKVESIRPIYSIDDRTYPPHSQVHFPFLYEAPDGVWYMTHREGPHGWGKGKMGVGWKDEARVNLFTDDRVQTVYSTDFGKSWHPWAGLKADSWKWRLFVTRLRNGTLLSHRYILEDLMNDARGKLKGTGIILRSTDDGKNWKQDPAPIRDIPFRISREEECGFGMWGHVRERQDGALLVAMQGGSKVHAGEPSGNGVLLSEDEGKSWRYLSAIADSVELGNEGCSETDIVKVGGNEFLAVYRTGTEGASSLHQSRSHDGGKTWEPAENLNIRHGVSPQLLLLENGVLILSYGNRKVHVRCSEDSGRTWSDPLQIYGGPGSGYTDIQALDENRFRIVFDASTFREPPEPQAERNEIRRAVIRVDKYHSTRPPFPG